MDLGLPAQQLLGTRGVADEVVHLGGPQVAGIELDVGFPVQAGVLEGDLHEVAHRVGGAGGHDVVARLVGLQHRPHGLDVLLGVAPVARRVEVAQPELVGQPGLDRRDAHGDLAGDERLAAAGGLVVEQDAVDGEQAVGLAVVARHPVGVDLRRAVGRAGVEGRVLVLRRRRGAEHLRRRRLVEAGRHVGGADGLQQPGGAKAGDVAGELGLVETHPHVRLRRQVVDLRGVDRLQQRHQPRAVGQVAVVQEQPGLRVVRVTVKVVDARGVERRCAPDQPVHLVALVQQQLGQVGAVLAGDAGDECALGLGHGCGGLPSCVWTALSLRGWW